MKKFLLIASLIFASGANAAQTDWKSELEQYKQHIETLNNGELWVRTAFYSGLSITTCTLAAGVTAATFVSDTIPLTNALSEIIANNANPDYQTYEKIMSVETLANAGRGAAGGAVIGVFETLEFINLWLGGNEELAFNQLKKNYASTIATANALFADQGKCLMSYSKVLLTRVEMRKIGMIPDQPTQQIPVPMSRP
jgi:hypothetical protein